VLKAAGVLDKEDIVNIHLQLQTNQGNEDNRINRIKDKLWKTDLACTSERTGEC
jgi:hypothetical protein